MGHHTDICKACVSHRGLGGSYSCASCLGKDLHQGKRIVGNHLQVYRFFLDHTVSTDE
jgi:hypothetical protein